MNNKPNITLSNTEHNQTPVVKVVFAYNQPIINKLKETTNAKWSASQKCWFIAREEFNLNTFFENFRELAYVDYSGLKENTIIALPGPKKRQQIISEIKSRVLTEESVAEIHRFREWMEQKRYSPLLKTGTQMLIKTR